MASMRMLAASLLAAVSLATGTPASAADLNGETYNYDDGSDDEQGRYSEYYRRHGNGDGYREQGRNDYSYDDRQYRERDRDRYRGSLKDNDYLEPMERHPRYSEDEGRANGRYGCTPRDQIRQRLLAEGWRNVQRVHVRPNVVVIRAYRPSGRAFELQLDRCTGEVLAQRPSRFGPFGAYQQGPRRYGSSY